jgi:hypothetical protein
MLLVSTPVLLGVVFCFAAVGWIHKKSWFVCIADLLLRHCPAEAETPVLEFVINDSMVKEVEPSKERVMEVLESVGFDADRQASPVASLSGERLNAWPHALLL